MKAALGFGQPIAFDRVEASLARQDVVRASIKRAHRVLERRAMLNILRQRSSSATDPSATLYHCVVLRALPPGRGSPGFFGDFVSDTSLMPPPPIAAHLMRSITRVAPVRCAWFMILIPALGALERCLLPQATPAGTCLRVVAVSGSSVYGRIRFVKVT